MFELNPVGQLLHTPSDDKDEVAENNWALSHSTRTCDGNGSGVT